MTAASDRWISAFLEAQSAELDAARNTLLAYGRDLKDFADFVATAKRDFESVDRDLIEGYMVSLDALGLAASTRARRLSAVKQLFRFAFEEGWRRDNPALRIKGPSKTKSLPKTLSETEVEALLTAAATHGRTPEDRLRNACLMEVLYATGMRVSELVSLPANAGVMRPIEVKIPEGSLLSAPFPAPVGGYTGQGREAVQVPLSLAGGRGPPDPPAVPRADQGNRRRRRRFACQGHAAPPAPCLRDASSGQWRGSARDPDASGPCRHLDDRDLHPWARRTAEGPRPYPSPAGHEALAPASVLARQQERGIAVAEEPVTLADRVVVDRAHPFDPHER